MRPDFENLSVTFHGFFVERLRSLNAAPRNVKTKRDGTKVSDADLELQADLAQFVSRLFPLPIVSEEQEHAWPPPCPDFWVFDPIDGSNNQDMGLPLYGSMVTRVENRIPVFTCIFLPEEERADWQPPASGFYFAGRGQGAWRFRRRRPTKLWVGEQERLREANLLLEGSSRILIEDERIRHLIQATARFRNDITPAWALTRLALGKVELVVALANKPTDNIHGLLFTAEAGGRVTDFEGNPPTLTNCGNLLYSNGVLHNAALEALAI